MKIKILFFVLGAIFILANLAESGAAVAKTKKAGGAHGPARPSQLPPGYVMGPNGIEKIPQQGEHESAAEESSEDKEEQAAQVKDDVGLDQIMEALQSSGKAWELIISRQDKQVIVGEFIKKYASQGVVIKKPAEYYANFIDEMAKGSSEMLTMPFDRVLQVVAVMEYDFDNGQNKDMLAQKILGPQVYEKNKQRLMQQANRPVK